jgi:predicted amidohydrolase
VNGTFLLCGLQSDGIKKMKSTSHQKVRVALVQLPPVYLNLAESLKKLENLSREAADDGAKLIVFPESWLAGYPVWLDYAPEAAVWDNPSAKALYRLLAEQSIRLESAEDESLKKLSEEIGAYLVVGSNEKKGKTVYNSILQYSPSGDRLIHRKLMPTYTERLVWGSGDGSTLEVMETEFGKVGSLICWEHWMPLLRATYHAKEEDIHIAQWPYVKDLHQNACRNYAFEGQCFVLASGCMLSKKQMMEGISSHGNSDYIQKALEMIESIPAEDDENLLKGGSAVIKPDHEYLLEPLYDEECIRYADLELSLSTEGRLFMDSNGHYSRPDVFTLSVDTREKNNVSFD